MILEIWKRTAFPRESSLQLGSACSFRVPSNFHSMAPPAQGVRFLNPDLEDLGSQGLGQVLSQVLSQVLIGPPEAGGAKNDLRADVDHHMSGLLHQSSNAGFSWKCQPKSFMVPLQSVFGSEAKSFVKSTKREAPNPTVLPLETLSLPCLVT